mmetsp:Transcript_91241/g.175005  ORF Transcript_91241/g.175005 Transcript_91241/m.175005 type:complete len:252 (+) Transcript_91241:68-823(+)
MVPQTMPTVFAILFALAPLTAVATAPGAIKMDNYTFDKMLSLPGYNWLVKVDIAYAYSEVEDEFKALSKLAHVVPNFFIGEMPCSDYGEKENHDFVLERWGHKKRELPVYYLYKAGKVKPLKYKGRVKADQIAVWLRKHGIHYPAVGTITELDEIATKFMLQGHGETEIEAAKKIVGKEFKDDRKAQMYVAIMEKVKEKGEDYIEKEIARVNKILKGITTKDKAAELNDKLKILSGFERNLSPSAKVRPEL